MGNIVIPKNFEEKKGLVIAYGYELEYEHVYFLVCEKDIDKVEKMLSSELSLLKPKRVHAILSGSCLDANPVAICYELRNDKSLVFTGLHRMYRCPARKYEIDTVWPLEADVKILRY